MPFRFLCYLSAAWQQLVKPNACLHRTICPEDRKPVFCSSQILDHATEALRLCGHQKRDDEASTSYFAALYATSFPFDVAYWDEIKAKALGSNIQMVVMGASLLDSRLWVFVYDCRDSCRVGSETAGWMASFSYAQFNSRYPLCHLEVCTTCSCIIRDQSAQMVKVERPTQPDWPPKVRRGKPGSSWFYLAHLERWPVSCSGSNYVVLSLIQWTKLHRHWNARHNSRSGYRSVHTASCHLSD